MALIKQYDKRSGITYVYESKSYWDKEKKQPRSKRTLIGRLDPVTGEVVPTDGRGRRRKKAEAEKEPAAGRASAVPARRQFAGASWLLDQLGAETGAAEDLQSCFPGSWKQILSAAYYLALDERKPLSHFSRWARLHRHPWGREISGPEMEALFQGISRTAEDRFFHLQAERHTGRKCWAFEWGIGRAVVVEEESGLPLSCCRITGRLPEEAALRELWREPNPVGGRNIGIVMRGTLRNDARTAPVFGANLPFLMPLPVDSRPAEAFIREIGAGKQFYEVYSEELGLYVFSKEISAEEAGLRGSGCVLHLYYDDDRSYEEEEAFRDRLKRLREELITGRRVPEHEEDYDRFFTIRALPSGVPLVSYNQEEVDGACENFGFSALLSRGMEDPVRALRYSRLPELAEGSFRGVFEESERGTGLSSGSSGGRIFAAFTALHYLLALRRRMEKASLLAEYTVHELLDELDLVESTDAAGGEDIPAAILRHCGKIWRRLEEEKDNTK